jgi:hypothetical protein
MFTIKSNLGYAIDFPGLDRLPATKDGKPGELRVESIPPDVMKTLNETYIPNGMITVEGAAKPVKPAAKPEAKPEPVETKPTKPAVPPERL